MRESPMRNNAQQRGYDPRVHSRPVASGGGRSEFDYLIRREYKPFFSRWSPSWNGTCTTVRFLPITTGENILTAEGWTPFRQSPDVNHWGDWHRVVPCAAQVGSQRATWVLFDQADSSMDPATNPYFMVHEAVKTAVSTKAMPQWEQLLARGENRGPYLPPPCNELLGQALMYQHKNKIYNPPVGSDQAKGPVLFTCKDSAIFALQSALERTRDGYTGDIMDYRAAYDFGDPIALWEGAFAQFYQEGHEPGGGHVHTQLTTGFDQQAQQARRQQMAGRGGSGGDNFGKRYDCRVVKQFENFSPELWNYRQMIAAMVRPWDELIEYPTYKEQIDIMANCLMPDILIYALGDMYRNEIPQFVWDKYERQRNQAFVPPGVPGAAPVTGFGGAPTAPAQGMFGSHPAPGASPAPSVGPGPVGAPVGGRGGPPVTGFGGAPAGGHAGPPVTGFGGSPPMAQGQFGSTPRAPGTVSPGTGFASDVPAPGSPYAGPPQPPQPQPPTEQGGVEPEYDDAGNLVHYDLSGRAYWIDSDNAAYYYEDEADEQAPSPVPQPPQPSQPPQPPQQPYAVPQQSYAAPQPGPGIGSIPPGNMRPSAQPAGGYPGQPLQQQLPPQYPQPQPQPQPQAPVAPPVSPEKQREALAAVNAAREVAQARMTQSGSPVAPAAPAAPARRRAAAQPAAPAPVAAPVQAQPPQETPAAPRRGKRKAQ